jgi:predicted small lipoprotein YifL
MRTFCLAATIAIALSALAGCGADDTNEKPPATKQAPFEADGAWVYLGPSDVPHILTIGDSTLKYVDVAGAWSSSWTLKAYDNDANHFQATFVSGTGTYLPTGTSLSGTYDLNGTVLTVQTAQGLSSYPPLQAVGTCTSATDGTPVPDCRLYIKQQN